MRKTCGLVVLLILSGCGRSDPKPPPSQLILPPKQERPPARGPQVANRAPSGKRGFGTPAPVQPAEAEAVRRGLQSLAKGDHEQALAEFAKALEVNPRSAEAHAQRAWAYLLKGEPGPALEESRRAQLLDSRCPAAYAAAGAVWLGQGEPEIAVNNCDVALRGNAEDARAHLIRGQALNQAGRAAEALRDFEYLLGHEPPSAAAYCGRAQAQLRLGKLDAAVADCGAALRLAPKLAEAYLCRSAAYARQGEKDRAAADRKRAVELDPRVAEFEQRPARNYHTISLADSRAVRPPETESAAATKKAIILRTPAKSVAAVRFSPDGKLLAAAGVEAAPDGASARVAVIVYDPATGRPRASLQGLKANVLALAFSPDGNTLATAGADGTVGLWDVATGGLRHSLTGHGDAVAAVAFSPDGRWLASGSHDQTVKVWEAASGKPHASFAFPGALVQAVAFLPDGRRLAVGGGYGNSVLEIWDVVQQKKLFQLDGHAKPVTAVAVTRDGSALVSASFDRTIRVWDLAARKTQSVLTGHAGEIRSLSFSSDEKTLASCGYNTDTILLWDWNAGRPRGRLATAHNERWRGVDFSPDGRWLVGGGWNSLELWDVSKGLPDLDAETAEADREGTLVLRGHLDAVGAVAYSPDGTMLASASDDQTVKLWDARDGSLLATLKGAGDYHRFLVFSPDGLTLAAAGYRQGNITLWDVASRKEKAVLRGPHGGLLRAALSPDGNVLAAAYSAEFGTPTICLWDVKARKELTQLRQEGRAAGALAFSPDGRWLAEGTGRMFAQVGDEIWNQGTVTARDWKTAKESASWLDALGAVRAIAFSPDGSGVAFGGQDGRVQLHRPRDARRHTVLAMQPAWVNALAFSPDGRFLAVGNQNHHVSVWDVAADALFDVLDGHTGAVLAVAFAPDGKHLASASRDNTVRISTLTEPRTDPRLEALRRYKYPGEIRALAVSPDGKRLALGGTARAVVIWDLSGPTPRPTTWPGHDGCVSGLAFSPDGHLLACSTGSADARPEPGSVKIWDLASAAERTILPSTPGGANSVAFSPDQRLLVATLRGQPALAWVWEMPAGKAVGKLYSPPGISCAAFFPNGKSLATAGGRKIMLWDPPPAPPGAATEAAHWGSRASLPTWQGRIHTLSVTADGLRLVASDDLLDTTIWDATTLKLQRTLPGSRAALSPDGTLLANVDWKKSYNQPVIWDLKAGKRRPPGAGAHLEPILCMAFTSDGKRLFTASRDGTVKLWETKRGRECWTFAD